MGTWNTGWYIDAFVIKAAAEITDPANENFLAGTSVTHSYNTTGGHKWMVQVAYYNSSSPPGTTTLGTGSGQTRLRLRICTNYVAEGDHHDYDVNFYTGDATGTPDNVSSGDSIFFGYGSKAGVSDMGLGSGVYNTGASALQTTTTGLRLLADQSVGDPPLHAMTRVQLFVSSNGGSSYTIADTLFINPGTAAEMTGPPADESTPGGLTDGQNTQGIYLVQRNNASSITRNYLQRDSDVAGSLSGPYYVVRRRARTGSAATDYYDNNQASNGVIGTTSNTASASGSVPSTTFQVSQWAWVDATAALAKYHVAAYDSQDAATAAGDPHITTLDGEHYEFDYLGPFRLYEATAGGQKLTINALAKLGPGRWNKKQYLRELYIQHGDKWAHVDMGFRGSPLKIIASNGLEHEEKSLEFDLEAKRYSFSSGYRTTDRTEAATDDLPALVRNAIDFVIVHTRTGAPTASIHLENVNKYNLQPCRTTVHPAKDATDAKGCLVARRYASVAALDDLRDTTALREPSEEDLERIPELEIAPIKRNIQWQ
tara:strand:+ start:2045 stop:3667 length:1623 start_codon:yes stop_codon:yes gene_type:complete